MMSAAEPGYRLTLLCFLLALGVAGVAAGACERCKCSAGVLDCRHLPLGRQWAATDTPTTTPDGVPLGELLMDYDEMTHVTAFPASSTLWRLSLSHNKIVSIDHDVFRNLTNLTELDLGHNQLTSDRLSKHVFRADYSPINYQPIPTLKILRLGANLLHTLDPDQFEHLPNVELLDLTRNDFRVLDMASGIAIASLKQLKVLDLSYNNLRQFPATILHTTKALEILSLEGNLLVQVPEALEDSHALKELNLNGNPVGELKTGSFPPLPTLEILHLSGMPNLTALGPGSLASLSGLHELHCSHNPRLAHISPKALSRAPGDDAEYREWPPLTRLWVNDNRLQYLEKTLLAHWDDLEVIDIRSNPWMCDCKNQWLVSELVGTIAVRDRAQLEAVRCAGPEEMHGRQLLELGRTHYDMRCLDSNDAKPERDAAMLVGVLVGVLLAIPATLGVLLLWRRARHVGILSRQGCPSTAYKRAFNEEDLS